MARLTTYHSVGAHLLLTPLYLLWLYLLLKVVGVDSADRGVSYILGAHPELMVEIDHTETWFMSEQVGEDLSPLVSATEVDVISEVTEDQRDRSVTLVHPTPKPNPNPNPNFIPSLSPKPNPNPNPNPIPSLSPKPNPNPNPNPNPPTRSSTSPRRSTLRRRRRPRRR